jgi:hypothetical protein
MELAIIGIIAALNFIIIKIKFSKKRYEDGAFDVILLLIIMALFGGSYAGLVVGTVASLFISLYFLASPPEFFSGKDGMLHTFLQKAKRRKPNDFPL